MSLPSPLLVATRNVGKYREMTALLRALSPRTELRSLREEPGYEPPEEGAPDYLGNARLKAHHAARALGLPSLADDSGLEVDALDGAPGPRSARFAGEGASDMTNNEKLLLDLGETAERTARYRCVVVLAWPDGHEAVGEGTCEGTIGREPRGTGGFGYDPYFLLADGRSMAELAMKEKNRLSHRARAIEDLLRRLA